MKIKTIPKLTRIKFTFIKAIKLNISHDCFIMTLKEAI